MSRFTIKNLMEVEDSAGGEAEEGLEMIAIGSDRPEGGDGVRVPAAWIDELEQPG